MNGRPRGMVLVSVLWVMVAMTMAASIFSLWVDQSRKKALDLIANAEYELAARSVEAVAIYARATSIGGPEGVPWPADDQASQAPMFDSIEDFMSGAPPRSALQAGVGAGYLRMDGSVLEAGNARVMIRDRAGLIGLVELNSLAVYESLSSLAPSADGAERLRDTLADYMDEDQLHRLHGAEAADYLRRGRAPPADGVLRSPLQLRDVLSWDDVLASKDDAWLLEVFRVDGGGFINANTASQEALELVMPSPDHAASIVSRRSVKPFRSAVEVGTLAASSGEELFAGIEPADGMRIWRWQRGGMTAVVDDIQFDALLPGRAAIILNWSSRVALSETMAERPVEQIDHPLFHAKNYSLR